jgi:hypothetical protein
VANSGSLVNVGANSSATVYGTGNTIGICGSGSHIFSSGNAFNFSTAGFTTNIEGNSNIVNSLANSSVLLNGIGDTVYASNCTINLGSLGMGGTTHIIGNNDFVILPNGVSSNTSIVFNGSGNSVSARGASISNEAGMAVNLGSVNVVNSQPPVNLGNVTVVGSEPPINLGNVNVIQPPWTNAGDIPGMAPDANKDRLLITTDVTADSKAASVPHPVAAKLSYADLLHDPSHHDFAFDRFMATIAKHAPAGGSAAPLDLVNVAHSTNHHGSDAAHVDLAHVGKSAVVPLALDQWEYTHQH